MSTAHRPNFTPAKGRESKSHLSAQTSKFDIPQHTALKFRAPASSSSAPRRDLKRELELAEIEAQNRKRVKSGLEPIALPKAEGEGKGDEEEGEGERRRREAIAQALLLDKESDSESDSSEEAEKEAAEGEEEEDPSSSSEDESDEEEDEQQLLLRELEKIKSERAAEKARQAALDSTAAQLSREEEIALGNPLLNLQNAMGGRSAAEATAGSSWSTNGDGGKSEMNFGVKRRWDDDVIFKNQASAAGNSGRGKGGGGFVNDLTRSEFHKKFMNRYIK